MASDDVDAAVARVVAHLAAAPQVVAVVITGSRAGRALVTGSDVDLFVYADDEVYDVRAQLAASLADSEAEIVVGDTTFGSSDAWRSAAANIWFDITYWPPSWADAQLDRVLIRCEASLGYTTAFWRSIVSGRPLYERDGWHADLQRRARVSYPEALVRSIVSKNMPWLAWHPFSFRHQIELAVGRGDRLSVNHRLAAWFASYFDVLFALNRTLHPGEKRLVDIAEAECQLVPPEMRSEIEAALAAINPLPHLDRLMRDLQQLLEAA